MAIIQVGDHEYEVLADCKKCKAITPHRWVVYYYYGKDDEIIRYEMLICLNCKHREENEKIVGRL